MKKKVSIIIPIYSAETYIASCVQSLFDQTLADIEYIFVDDCSLDDSISILKRILEDYPARKGHVKIIQHKENRGVATTRNTGLDNATGKYIGWVDADDWIEPDMFEKMYNSAESKQADLVWCNFRMTFTDSSYENQQQVAEDSKVYLLSLIKGEMQGMLWNKLIRREIFLENQIRFLDENNLGEDRNVLIKVLFYCNNIIHLEELLYHYMQFNIGAITRDMTPRRVYEEINNTRDIVCFLREKNVSWIPDSDLQNFMFRSKRKLLYTTDLIHFEKWANIFPESNRLLYKSYLGMRHKIVGFLAIYKIKGPLRLWINIKKRYQTSKT
ncbi:glycosyltransferase family 2 protein [Sphingobacterium sp. DN00404]|uniref:Glycosyltransferase family 2 protein n=1 Tax=Sphingobacterium micropteri TaxID=2763501 RepID=A0ABR7YLN1_9SPHI|nr:glycosyltransferase family 2 protein [Sphingobacterium micropteri]MBD1432232.1 glycosyltransferase family 2 protein [Sphingobacterium micropteri]